MSPSSPVSSSSSSSSSASPSIMTVSGMHVTVAHGTFGVSSMSLDDLWGSEPSSPMLQESPDDPTAHTSTTHTAPFLNTHNIDHDSLDSDMLINNSSNGSSDANSSSSSSSSSSSGSGVGQGSESVKPAFSYASLIAQAIISSPQKKMTLSAIYSWVTATYPYYSLKDLGWQVGSSFWPTLTIPFFRFFLFLFFPTPKPPHTQSQFCSSSSNELR